MANGVRKQASMAAVAIDGNGDRAGASDWIRKGK